ncbi:hypothetical protein RB623_27495 [Mesorhizobium sp. LHD-90]|uniref:hypothetical protein n=1 Tax=Mesorhizobium sp. LHD-90 TaxID=3071414 RepID=UPI0027E04203|nr:hypothetical protein [Mesorhizobium sp. LHD-90]MDQ6437815.1 hypothetical protein [Mesorhizobium sp. LHD-90]
MVEKRRPPSRLAEGRELEVQHLAETTDLSPSQARELLRRHGNDWEKIRQEAETFKAES